MKEGQEQWQEKKIYRYTRGGEDRKLKEPLSKQDLCGIREQIVRLLLSIPHAPKR